MDDRFRLDGVELGVDRVRSTAGLDLDGTLACRIAAADTPSAVDRPPTLVIARLRVRLDADGFGADLDESTAGGVDQGFDEAEFMDPDEPEAVLIAGSRYPLVGRVTVLAGDVVRIRASAAVPWSAEPVRVDAVLRFGGRRRSAV